MVLGHLGVLGQVAHQIAFRFLKQTLAHLLTQSHKLCICQHWFTWNISGATEALLEPDPNKRGTVLPGEGHEQQAVHLWPLSTQPCCIKRPPCHHGPRPGHGHRHQRPHLVHRPRRRLPHICPRRVHHCQTASEEAESPSQLQLHTSR